LFFGGKDWGSKRKGYGKKPGRLKGGRSCRKNERKRGSKGGSVAPRAKKTNRKKNHSVLLAQKGALKFEEKGKDSSFTRKK